MLVELAIGDAYGAGFEYAEASFVAAHNTLTGYVEHPFHHGLRPGCYTDDTQMSIAIAELLVSADPWTPENLAERFVAAFRRDERVGYSRGFYELLRSVSSGVELLARVDPRSSRSGAAMRAGPIGVLPEVAEVLAYAAIQARITHDTDAGIQAAQAAALAAHYCYHHLGPRSAVARWVDEELRRAGGRGGWAEPFSGSVGAEGWMSVRAALTALGSCPSLSTLLRTCVAYTGDVDTVATIALAAASTSSEVHHDLPAVLWNGLEDGTYGRSYLRRLEHRLFSRYPAAS
ncbi:MAG: ADP-ribosylglycohydrolase family protein [Actinomycetota bacterium]|nr:ADP-ribosylglycohydrolase family protein [Actinomycetota bacterium]